MGKKPTKDRLKWWANHQQSIMSTQTITVFSHLYSVSVDKEAEKVLSITQNITDIEDIRQNLEGAVSMVQKYQSIGFYPMAEPDFITEVIGNFSDVALSRQDVVNENRHQVIEGFTGCVRVFQLPDVFVVQVRDNLTGFEVDYDDQSWEILDVRALSTN